MSRLGPRKPQVLGKGDEDDLGFFHGPGDRGVRCNMNEASGYIRPCVRNEAFADRPSSSCCFTRFFLFNEVPRRFFHPNSGHLDPGYIMRLLPLFSVLIARTALAQPVESREISIAGWPDVTAFLAMIADIMPVNHALRDICGVITAGELAISTIFGIPTTENDGCGDVTMFFARGTCDPGNVGALTGPWFFKALENKLKKSGKRLAVNGFDYPASVDGYLNGAKGHGDKL